MTNEATWFDSLVVGREYLYCEDGTEVIVSLEEKTLADKWVDLTLRAVRSIRGGIFGEINAGEKWTCGAMLTDGGYPNAYCGWGLREAGKPEVKP